jgi:hypothetical protein
MGKDVVFPPFGKRYFQNVTEFSGWGIIPKPSGLGMRVPYVPRGVA